MNDTTAMSSYARSTSSPPSPWALAAARTSSSSPTPLPSAEATHSDSPSSPPARQHSDTTSPPSTPRASCFRPRTVTCSGSHPPPSGLSWCQMCAATSLPCTPPWSARMVGSERSWRTCWGLGLMVMVWGMHVSGVRQSRGRRGIS